ncbi:MAG: polysaccharide deacetylase family protein [Planctomycetaceae bacterium]|nr:polysaccharide deacetylase family protein [Planctomycetaceae bacterium]
MSHADRKSRFDLFATCCLAAAVGVALIVAGLRLPSAWELPPERYLLIHADDAGLCSAANRGTIAALEQGIVTSASIMAPCPGFEEFAAYAESHPEKDFGVHVTLTSEWDDVRWGPISDPTLVPSLVDAKGWFWKSADEFARNARLEDVEIEVRAQIRSVQEAGVVLSHLDNHMNSLFRRPEMIALFVRISRDVGLPIRYAKSLPRGWENELPAAVVDAYYEQVKALYTRRNPLMDRIEADNYQVAAGEKRSYLLTALRGLDPGWTELVVHCCDGGMGDWIPPDGDRRVAETVALCSQEFADELRVLGIRPVDWKDLRRLAGEESRRSW